LPVGEVLVLAALDRGDRALGILYAKRRAAIVAEIKFREVAVQMLLIAMLVDAANAALEN
jgi:hypothetical protein